MRTLNKRPSATELLAHIAAGRVVYIQTSTRMTKIDAKAVARFNKAGVALLKDGPKGQLYMASGRNYVDCSYCGIVIQ